MASVLNSVSEGRNNNFNLIRMLAASGVLVSHAFPLSLGKDFADPISDLFGVALGTICVYAFFILSGFFIAKSFEHRFDLAHFVISRVLRIFPALAVCLLVVITAGLILTSADFFLYLRDSISFFFRNFTLFFGQTYLIGIFEDNPYSPAINGSLWTLSYEVICYFITFLIGMAGAVGSARRFVVFFLFFFALYLLVYLFGPNADVPGRIIFVLQLGLPYVVGTAFWVFKDKILLSFWFAILSFLAISVFLWLEAPTFMWIPPFAYLLFFIGYVDSPHVQLYNKVGDYSYGMYIYAFPVQQILVYFGVVTPLLNIVLAIPLTLSFAVLSWHIIEKPALRWKNFPRTGWNRKPV